MKLGSQLVVRGSPQPTANGQPRTANRELTYPMLLALSTNETAGLILAGVLVLVGLVGFGIFRYGDVQQFSFKRVWALVPDDRA